ncbi:hypothetical protein TCA2_0206 [Paenibacillus sp. TCA20]|uniref:Uncharacterized protein n=1 Tax=Paenibacillus urinalis TaxID=521520 RepID=A0AAX3N3S0_9BACL|nr:MULTISPECIES: hypothetical protein [Paenibacillus]WDH84513.1 hypothetical protein PUW23_10005 [Paenibacillus urinalis]GAK38480.1 hypothetical protein TCA2_0206 [Paenibacillus sp. TCA20]
MQPWSTIVVLGLCVIVFAWFMPKSRTDSGQKVVKDVESTLDRYLAEIELENEKVIHKLKQYQQEWSETDKRREQEIRDLRQQLSSLHSQVAEQSAYKETVSVPISTQERELAAAVEANPILESKEVPSEMNSIQSRFPELFKLDGEGKSVDYISSKLNMPKGEVQVILQLGNKEERR